MSAEQVDVTVRDAPEQRRYEAWDAATLAGFASYVLVGESVIAFVHTEVDPAFEGRGIASQIATFALDDARTRGLAVVPRCPFFASFIRRHPEYADLVAEAPLDS